MEWKDINYFDNPFSEDIGKIFFFMIVALAFSLIDKIN